MRKKTPTRDSGLRRSDSVPLPGFLRAMREKAGITQRDLGSHVKRTGKFIYDCETGQRRVSVGEFIAWSVACGVSPLEALRAYGTVLGQPWAGQPAAFGRFKWNEAEFNEAPEFPPAAVPARDRKVAMLLEKAAELLKKQ